MDKSVGCLVEHFDVSLLDNAVLPLLGKPNERAV